MGIFRKRKLSNNFDHSSVTIGKTVIPVTKSVCQKGSREPVSFVEMKEVDTEEYAKSLNLPVTEDYLLRDMLKAGVVPQEVPVSGILDSHDPTDLSNQGVPNALFDQLSDSVKEPASKPAPTPEPTSETTPTE